MTNIQLIKVFLASPGDVAREGEIVRETLGAINRTLGEKEGIQFALVNWKTDSFPEYGNDAQALLNEQIADMSQYDLFIGIMWNRFGTPTPRAESGTEEEFNRAVESLEKNAKPEIMFYFNRAPCSFTSAEEAEQKTRVLRFREKVQERGLPHDYDGAENFRKDFRNHIETWLVKKSPRKLEPPRIEVESKPVQAAGQPEKETILQTLSDSGMWVLIKNGFYLASEVSELGDNKVSLKLPVNSADEDAAFRSLQPNNFGRVDPIPFAHQNTGAIARVDEAKRTSVNGKSFWELLLSLEENDSGYLSEMSLNGVSADQIAELRARFILLNERPAPPRKQSRPFNLNDGMLDIFVSGLNTRVKVEGSVLPDLWRNVNKDVNAFLPLARLWSVFHLVTSNTCQYILELTLGPIADEKVHVKFRGQRYKQYVNVDPYIINFEGDCDLTTK
ncbi:MAG TPA: hypothetical protein VK892_13360 [Pyrinomonadaceae bacterium]|nr:hypothetical protein [Pyrinomonadaceae bacterium]